MGLERCLCCVGSRACNGNTIQPLPFQCNRIARIGLYIHRNPSHLLVLGDPFAKDTSECSCHSISIIHAVPIERAMACKCCCCCCTQSRQSHRLVLLTDKGLRCSPSPKGYGSTDIQACGHTTTCTYTHENIHTCTHQ